MRASESAGRVGILGGESGATRAVEAGSEAFDTVRWDSVAGLTPTAASAVVVVLPAISVSAGSAVDEVRRTHGDAAVVAVGEELPAARVDAVAPPEADAVRSVLEDVLETSHVRRSRERARRVRSVAPGPGAGTAASEPDPATACERLASGGLYDSAWLLRADAEGSQLRTVAASGVPAGGLAPGAIDDEAPWSRALRTGSPVVDGDRETTIAVPVGRDCLVCTTAATVTEVEVTALAELAASISDATRSDGAMLGEAIAHELNNHLDLAMVQSDLIEEESDHVAHVERALDRIESTVEEVRALFADPNVEQTSLARVAEAVHESVDPGVDLSVEAGQVEADERLLRLLFSNLFRNAEEHGGEGVTTVEVGPLADGGFYVADDGVGFDEARRSLLFEWGVSEDGGSGAGLALVSLVAERHGWEVDASGDDGARFEFHP